MWLQNDYGMEAYVYGRFFGQLRNRHRPAVSSLSSRSKSQGVIWRGETKVEAKARIRNTARCEGCRGNSRSVTLGRPEAEVIYAWAG